VDLTAVRRLLRAERKARRWSLDRLADASGVNRTTIQDIETNEDGKPQLATIAKLIEAMPPLTVSSFFAKIETRGAGHETGSATTTGGPRDRAVPAVTPEAIDADREVGRAIARIVEREILRRQMPGARVRGAGGRAPHRKNR